MVSKEYAEIVAAAAAKIKDFSTLEAAALEVGKLTGIAAPTGKEGTATDIKAALLEAATAAGLNEIAAGALIDDGMNRGKPEFFADKARNRVTEANSDTVRAIGRNRTLAQVGASVYALITERGLKPEEIDQWALITAASANAVGADIYHTAVRSVIAAAVAAAMTNNNEDMPAGGPLEHVRNAVDRAAHTESRYISVSEFEKIMMTAEILEREGKALLPGEVVEEAAILKEIAAIKRNPTLGQLRESTLLVAEPVMFGRFAGRSIKNDATVGSKKICVDIFERLCNAYLEAVPAYTQPIKLDPFFSAEAAEAEAKAEAERKAKVVAALEAARAEEGKGGLMKKKRAATTGMTAAFEDHSHVGTVTAPKAPRNIRQRT